MQPQSSIPEPGKSGSPDAAVAIIINPKLQGGSVLLIRRTERKGDPWSGQIAFPGGHKSRKDRTFWDTVVRETSEEIGIKLGEHEMLGVLPLVYSRTRPVLVAPFVFQLKSEVTIRLNEEVAESFWIPLGELSRIEATQSEVHVQDRKLMVDSYVYDGHVIWGLTFRIISILLNRP